MVNNKKEMPIIRQFGSKLSLLRALHIKLQGENDLHDPEELQQIFSSVYNIRSVTMHGGQGKPISNQQMAAYLNLLYPTLRMAISMQNSDPVFVEYVKGM